MGIAHHQHHSIYNNMAIADGVHILLLIKQKRNYRTSITSDGIFSKQVLPYTAVLELLDETIVYSTKCLGEVFRVTFVLKETLHCPGLCPTFASGVPMQW